MIKILAILLLCSLLSKVESAFRLSPNLIPYKYNLEILTHLSEKDGYKFSGKVNIRVTCKGNTKSLVLHSSDLTIAVKDVEIIEIIALSQPKTLPYHSSKITDNLFIYNVTETMVNGTEYEIVIPFKGDLNTEPIGYYRSSYYDLTEKKNIWIASTHFEPLSARRAFPCFDEPALKAKFNIKIGHHKELRALSNTPIKFTEKIKERPDYVWDHFNETVDMSTYLVAYAVHDFDYKESLVRASNVHFKIWTRHNAVEQTEYAREVGPKLLTFYEEYLKQKFPLTKMDMIAIPVFTAGAMENWGLIMYRETALLFKPNVSTASDKHFVTTVIAHELAHQWFGNLVTMKWWNDIWLNEGFATYFASLGISQLYPEWNTLEEETVDYTGEILQLDSKGNSHPVSISIEHSEGHFDRISYAKGGIIIRMMHLFLGEEAFRYGISKYIEKRKYGNAEQKNLWDTLTDAAHRRHALPKTITVNEIMNSWTLQSGYPMITVKRNYRVGTAEITQERYFSRIPSTKTKDCWWIPLSYTTEIQLDFNSTYPKEWLKCDGRNQSTKLTIKNLHHNAWILFNVKLSGLYKVNYDEKNWNLLIETLNGPNYKKIHKMNRAQLIVDVLDLAYTDRQDPIIARRLIEYLKQENEYIPWKAALDNLHKIEFVITFTLPSMDLRTYVNQLLTPVYNKIHGLNVDCDYQLDSIKLKALIATYACLHKYNIGDCIETSKKLFQDWMYIRNPDKFNYIPVNIRSVVYCTAISHGGESQKIFLHQRYLNSNVQSEKEMIREALNCNTALTIPKPEINMQKIFIAFLRIAKDSFIRKIDEITVISKISQIVRENMTSNQIDELMRLFESNIKYFINLAIATIHGFQDIQKKSQSRTSNTRRFIDYLSKYTNNC